MMREDSECRNELNEKVEMSAIMHIITYSSDFLFCGKEDING